MDNSITGVLSRLCFSSSPVVSAEMVNEMESTAYTVGVVITDGFKPGLH